MWQWREKPREHGNGLRTIELQFCNSGRQTSLGVFILSIFAWLSKIISIFIIMYFIPIVVICTFMRVCLCILLHYVYENYYFAHFFIKCMGLYLINCKHGAIQSANLSKSYFNWNNVWYITYTSEISLWYCCLRISYDPFLSIGIMTELKFNFLLNFMEFVPGQMCLSLAKLFLHIGPSTIETQNHCWKCVYVWSWYFARLAFFAFY